MWTQTARHILQMGCLMEPSRVHTIYSKWQTQVTSTSSKHAMCHIEYLNIVGFSSWSVLQGWAGHVTSTLRCQFSIFLQMEDKGVAAVTAQRTFVPPMWDLLLRPLAPSCRPGQSPSPWEPEKGQARSLHSSLSKIHLKTGMWDTYPLGLQTHICIKPWGLLV